MVLIRLKPPGGRSNRLLSYHHKEPSMQRAPCGFVSPPLPFVLYVHCAGYYPALSLSHLCSFFPSSVTSEFDSDITPSSPMCSMSIVPDVIRSSLFAPSSFPPDVIRLPSSAVPTPERRPLCRMLSGFFLHLCPIKIQNQLSTILKYSMLWRYFKCDDLFFMFMSLSAFYSLELA